MLKKKILLLGFFLLFTGIDGGIKATSEGQDMPGLSDQELSPSLSSRHASSISSSSAIQQENPKRGQKRKAQSPLKKTTLKNPRSHSNSRPLLPGPSLITAHFKPPPLLSR